MPERKMLTIPAVMVLIGDEIEKRGTPYKVGSTETGPKNTRLAVGSSKGDKTLYYGPSTGDVEVYRMVLTPAEVEAQRLDHEAELAAKNEKAIENFVNLTIDDYSTFVSRCVVDISEHSSNSVNLSAIERLLAQRALRAEAILIRRIKVSDGVTFLEAYDRYKKSRISYLVDPQNSKFLARSTSSIVNLIDDLERSAVICVVGAMGSGAFKVRYPR